MAPAFTASSSRFTTGYQEPAKPWISLRTSRLGGAAAFRLPGPTSPVCDEACTRFGKRLRRRAKKPGEEPPDSLELLIVLGDRRLPEPDSKRILASTSCSVSSIELRAVSTRGSTVGEERASRTWGVPARREPDELSKAVLGGSAAGSALGRRNGLNCAACQRGWALAVPGQNGPAGTIPRLPLPAGVNHAARKGAG